MLSKNSSFPPYDNFALKTSRVCFETPKDPIYINISGQITFESSMLCDTVVQDAVQTDVLLKKNRQKKYLE